MFIFTLKKIGKKWKQKERKNNIKKLKTKHIKCGSNQLADLMKMYK